MNRASLDISEKRKVSPPCQESPHHSLVVKTLAQAYQVHYRGFYSFIFYGDTGTDQRIILYRDTRTDQIIILYGDTVTDQIIILLFVFCLLASGPAL